MKTNFFKKNDENKKNEVIKMSNEEMKSIEGGGHLLIVRNPDGTYQYVWDNN